MEHSNGVHVAILLPTYNGARFVEQQIRSFKNNAASFTIHWLDDQSTDATREIVREVARNANIPVMEWHQQQRQGIPRAFFTLLERVEADIYLFSDQDDIWQPGKIDATVTDLLPNLSVPSLSFSDPLMFRDDDPRTVWRLLDVIGTKAEVALEESRLFMAITLGNTQGFTRPLRDIFVRHTDIALRHAFMHDLWMYDIAVASGTVRILHNAPTTLYRLHNGNASDAFHRWKSDGALRVTLTWQQIQRYRRALSRNATGFILAASSLPQSQKLQRLLSLARLVATLDRRQSPIALARLKLRRVMWPNTRLALGLAAACLCSDAHDSLDT